MRPFRAPSAVLVTLLASFALAGCNLAESGDDALIIRGSAGSPAANAPERKPMGLPPGASTGNPASISIDLYALYLGTSPDCTDLVLVDDYGATPNTVDLVDGPVLFSSNPPSGSYGCIAFRMSDLVRVRPATTFGSCEAGVEYTSDIYRDGQTDLLDVDGNSIIGHGSDDAPADDQVTIFLSRDPSAAEGHGWSTHQIIALGSDLVVPGTSTFYWNGDNTIVSTEGHCGASPGQPAFQ